MWTSMSNAFNYPVSTFSFLHSIALGSLAAVYQMSEPEDKGKCHTKKTRCNSLIIKFPRKFVFEWNAIKWPLHKWSVQTLRKSETKRISATIQATWNPFKFTNFFPHLSHCLINSKGRYCVQFVIQKFLLRVIRYRLGKWTQWAQGNDTKRIK